MKAIAQTFTESKLPIVIVTTDGNANIPDDPKIPASMKIVYRGEGQTTYVTDQNDSQFLKYNGAIGIELRGTTSQFVNKKPYGLETRTAAGASQNVSLLGMPSENDWILNNMAYDPAYVRDYFSYRVARSMGQYSARTVHCELILNGAYMGLYMLQEKLKDDENRINIEELSTTDNNQPNLSGGYIMQGDREKAGDPLAFSLESHTGPAVQMVYDTPKAEEITEPQKAYIKSVFRALEANSTNTSLTNGYPSIIDVPSFIDYIIVNELASNVDAYQYSTFFHKDRGGKLRAGPVWDLNASLGRDLWQEGRGRSQSNVWQFSNGDNEGPRFFRNLFDNSEFKCYLAKRWNELIQPNQPLNLAVLNQILDSVSPAIAEAAARDRARWPGNPDLTTEINLIKTFLAERLAWIGSNVGSASGCANVAVPKLVINEIMYNPPGSEETNEFIEIKNAGTSAADLTGVHFSTLGVSYQFPAGSTLAAGGILVLTRDLASFTATYPTAPAPFGIYARTLPNSTHKLMLSDAFGNMIDVVEYFDKAPWPTAPDGNGASLELTSTDLDNNLAGSWFVRSTNGGSPGIENSSSLPIRLISFSSLAQENAVILVWKTTTELNADKFEVQRMNNKTWSTIGFVKTSGENSTYQFVDDNANKGVNYYRLKMVDLDETFSYSKIITSEIKLSSPIVFPNPADDHIYLRGTALTANQVSLYSITGKPVYKSPEAVKSIPVNNLSEGLYVLKLTYPDNSATTNQILIKR